MQALLRKHPVRSALAALALLSLIWGYNWVMMKIALRDAGAVDFAALRTLLGALSLFVVLLWLRRPLRPVQAGTVFLLGLLQTTGFIGFSVWALESGGVGKTVVLAYIMPFWVLLLAWPLLHEKLRGLQWLAVATALVGLVLLLQPWSLRGTHFSNILAILAGVFWAISTILAKKLRQDANTDLLSLTAWQMLFGALPLVVVAVVLPGPPIQWTGNFIIALSYNVVLGGALAWLLWLYALKHLPAGVASLGMLATPAISVWVAAIQLGEHPDALETAGMLLIAAALALLSGIAMRQHRRTHPLMGQE